MSTPSLGHFARLTRGQGDEDCHSPWRGPRTWACVPLSLAERPAVAGSLTPGRAAPPGPAPHVAPLGRERGRELGPRHVAHSLLLHTTRHSCHPPGPATGEGAGLGLCLRTWSLPPFSSPGNISINIMV